MALYTTGGRRRIAPPLRVRRWACCGTCCATAAATTWSTPAPSLLLAAGRGAGAPARPLRAGRRLARGLEPRVLARLPRRRRRAVGSRCSGSARACRQRAFCFSRLHAARLREEGLRGEVTVLRGRVRGHARAAEPRAGRAAGGVRGAADPREAGAARRSAGGRARGAAQSPGLRGDVLRRRPRARGAGARRSKSTA